jgi:myosin heavy subunit
MNKKMWLGLTGIILLALCGVTAWAVVTYNQLIQTQADLAAVQYQVQQISTEWHNTASDLEESRRELSHLTVQLQDARIELESTQSKLSDTDQNLTAIQTSLDQARAENLETSQKVVSTTRELASLQIDLDQANATIKQKQAELETANSTLNGLGITLKKSEQCFDVELKDNTDAANPDLDEVLNFIAEDDTDSNQYVKFSYDCSQFSRDVHNHAEAAGIRTAEVQVLFKDEPIGHALNAFITSDYGLVFIDCTTSPDTIARVCIGKEYRALPIDEVPTDKLRDNPWWDRLRSYYYAAGSDGHCIVSSITIYW